MATRIFRRQVRFLAGSTLTLVYQNLDRPVTIPAYKISIVNATNTDINITDQTSNEPFFIPAGSTLSIGEGLSGFGQLQDTLAVAPANVQYQVKLVSGAAGTGTVIITILGH
jgi:hypothetical protein